MSLRLAAQPIVEPPSPVEGDIQQQYRLDQPKYNRETCDPGSHRPDRGQPASNGCNEIGGHSASLYWVERLSRRSYVHKPFPYSRFTERGPKVILPPLLAFLAWIPLSLVLFRRYPIRVAILMNFLGGWALLPIARFSGDPSPFWILGNGLHTEYFLTKATVTG